MEDLLIRNARVVRAPGELPSEPTDVTIRAGRICDDPPSGAPVLDARGGFLTAGFWNCHVHLTEPVWAGAARAAAAKLQDGLDDMFGARGFTTVIDLASNSRDTFPLRRRIDEGDLRGPRILTATEAIRPWRGLPFYTKESVPWFLWWALPTPATSRGAARVARRQLSKGADVIKLFTGSYVARDRIRAMRPGPARAAVRAAHERDAPTFAHTSNRAGLLVALDAGIDVIAHVPDETDGTEGLLRDAAARGVWLIPTLDMFAQTVTRDRSYLAPIHDALRGFAAAGGRLLFGTDVGYLPDHDIRGELSALAECGLGIDDVLTMLTTNPSEAMGSGSGTVVCGEPADLVLLERLDTVADLASVRATIRAGTITWQARG